MRETESFLSSKAGESYKERELASTLLSLVLQSERASFLSPKSSTVLQSEREVASSRLSLREPYKEN